MNVMCVGLHGQGGHTGHGMSVKKYDLKKNGSKTVRIWVSLQQKQLFFFAVCALCPVYKNRLGGTFLYLSLRSTVASLFVHSSC